jgi:hypothetical protein
MDENYLHSCFGYTGEVSTPQILPTPTLLSTPKKSQHFSLSRSI